MTDSDIKNTPKNFTPTIVKQHIGPNTTHLIYHFENGYGASVVPEYDHNRIPPYYMSPIEGELELAVLKYIANEDDWSMCYDTSVADDVIRHITQQQVDDLLDQIAGL